MTELTVARVSPLAGATGATKAAPEPPTLAGAPVLAPAGSRGLELLLPPGAALAAAARALDVGGPPPAHLLPVRRVGRDRQGRTVVVFEPSGGATLGDLLAAAAATRCAAPELLGLLVLTELLDGLQAAHARGRWHGLLTPACCVLDGASPTRLLRDCPRDPRLRIAGCGVAALLPAANRERAVSALGGSPWLPPEVRHGGAPGPGADVWAAAAVTRALCLAAGGNVSARLLLLLDWLQRPAARRPTAASGLQRSRDLALEALAAWERARSAEARTVAEPDGQPAPRAPARAASRLQGPRGEDRARGDRGLAAGGVRDEPRRASPFAPAPVGWPAGDVVAGRGAVAWATLGPAAAAALLCLLLTAMLLLGSCA